MRILLIQPERKGKTIGFDQMVFCEPLGLEVIAGALNEHEVRILDMRINDGLSQTLKSFNPDICGISCSYTIDYSSSLRIARMLKQYSKDLFIVVGGHHPTMVPEDFFKDEIDAIVIGEGEFSMRELVEALEKGRDIKEIQGLFIKDGSEFTFTGERDLIEDLDVLPMPEYESIKKYRSSYYMGFQKPIALVETTRGCPYQCNFCSVWIFYKGRCRMKSPERVISEILRLKEKNILFTDDNFLINIGRVKEIVRLLKKKAVKKNFTIQARSDTIVRNPELISQLKEVGLKAVFIGFEKIYDNDLEDIGKNNNVKNNEEALEILRSLKVDVWASFIIDPDYNKDDFEKLREYIIEHQIETPTFSILTPLPGTNLYKEKEKELTIKDYDLFDIAHAVLKTRLPIQEFYKEYANLWNTPYSKYKLILEGFGALLKGNFSLIQLMKMLFSARKLSNPNFYLSYPSLKNI